MTTLDTHDGIGVVDAVDLLTPEQSDFTVEQLYKRGSNVKKRYSSSEYNNLDIYQINCTWFSALGEDEDAYIASRAIQFFTPGIPQVYYVGLLAGANDVKRVEATKQGREINRHDYGVSELDREMERPVVQRLRELMRFRTRCTAFDGVLEVHTTEGHLLDMEWRNGGEEARLVVDLPRRRCTIIHRNPLTGGITEFHP